MIRIRFSSDQDRVKGNYLLTTNSIVRRLRGQIFTVSERDLKLLDDHQIAYTVLPQPKGSDQTVRDPVAAEL